MWRRRAQLPLKRRSRAAGRKLGEPLGAAAAAAKDANALARANAQGAQVRGGRGVEREARASGRCGRQRRRRSARRRRRGRD